MANEVYTVLVDELTVHRQVGELTDPITGRVTGIQQGGGKTWFKDEKIPADLVSPLYREALDDEDHPLHAAVSRKLAKGSGDPQENLAVRLGLPMAGYDDMDEDDILAIMQHLPSSTIQAIKTYEAAHEGRERIAQYNIGFAQSPSDRQEGRAGSALDEDGAGNEDKAVSSLTTREVPEEGVVQVGDGITGTGDPQIAHGSQKEDDESKPAASRRRSRRPRPAASASKEGSGSGGDSE